MRHLIPLLLLSVSVLASAAEGPHYEGVYDVLSYGADPTGAADSAPAFQNAIDDACTGGMPATVIVPNSAPGKRYRVESPLFLWCDNLTLTGAGMDG